MKLSVTNLVNWIGLCERQWVWSQSWFPRGKASPMWLGSGVHESLASYYLTGDVDQARATYASWVSTSGHALEAKVSPEYWIELSALFWEQAELGSQMLDHYFVWDATHPLPGSVKYVEKFVSGAFETGDELRGRFDLVLEDRGELIVVDHKTYSSFVDQDFLDLDQQLTAYAWLVRRIFGRAPSRLILNILFRRAPKPPATLKNGSLSRAKDQSTTFELYQKELEAKGLDPREYEEVLDRLYQRDGEEFFRRIETSRSDIELDAFERRATQALRRVNVVQQIGIDEAVAMPSFTQCRQCPFKSPCGAFERGEDWEWLLKSQFSAEQLL